MGEKSDEEYELSESSIDGTNSEDGFDDVTDEATSKMEAEESTSVDAREKSDAVLQVVESHFPVKGIPLSILRLI